MSYITREDGEHFVIPSYRDVLTTKQKSQLKKEIFLFSQNYGEYITLQKKNASQYEVAFSPDPGYLLGETVWQYFKRPTDLIYCEIIPGTAEAILVIVKNSSVYLDGSFPLENIPEELIVFLTQQNNFEIYIYGNVSIAETPEVGKFSFDPKSVKSFTTLTEPVFPQLPLLKIYHLQLVDPVLKAHGIGVFPYKQLILVVVAAGLMWTIWSYMTTQKQNVQEIITFANPYQAYLNELSTPAVDQEIQAFLNTTKVLYTIPGWLPTRIIYTSRDLTATMQGSGSTVEALIKWADENHASLEIKQTGIYLKLPVDVSPRPVPTKIYPINDVIAKIVDDIAKVYPGNHLKISSITSQSQYKVAMMSLDLSNLSPLVISLLAKQFKDLPVALKNITVDVNNGNFNGSLTLDALGS